MRSLNNPQKRKAVLAEAIASPEQNEVQALNSKIEFLRSVLRSLLIRTDKERKDDIKQTLSELDAISSPLQLQASVDTYYNVKFFQSEPDVEFKIQLAGALYSYMKLRIPSYTNSTLRSISENSLDAAPLLKNFIEE